MSRKTRERLESCGSCSLWSGAVHVSMISLVLKWPGRPHPRRCRGMLLNGDRPRGGSTATMTTSGWCSQGPGAWGGGARGPPAAQCPPMKAIEDRAHSSLIAWRDEVSQDAIFFSACPVRDPVYGNRATRLPLSPAQHAIPA